MPTAVLGAEAPVAEAFAAGFLPPDIPSLGCVPFGTVLMRMLLPGFNVSVGFFWEFPPLCFVFHLSFCPYLVPRVAEKGKGPSRQRSAMPG